MVIRSLVALQTFRKTLTGRIGFVPTMGAFHDGHLSLVKESMQSTDHTIVSIFVNPTQFSPDEDFSSYPRLLENDLDALQGADNVSVYVGQQADLYPFGVDSATQITVPKLSAHWCGSSRPHFFGGVCSIVLRLFQHVRPTHAFFGEKDFQQLRIIQHMGADLSLPIQIIGCPILREADGLAMSSRNRYLTQADRQDATILYRTYQLALQLISDGIMDAEALVSTCRKFIHDNSPLDIDYVGIASHENLTPRQGDIYPNDRLMMAGMLGTTRLIDNGILA